MSQEHNRRNTDEGYREVAFGASANPTDDGDRDIREMLPEIEQLVEEGALVFLKWRCPGCGERCVDDVPNRYCSQGYRHTERKDGTPCGTLYTGWSFGYMLVWPLGNIGLEVERGGQT